jgi:preprotein translocase subunit SecA
MLKLPSEIIYKILLELDDINISLELKNDWVSKKLCERHNYYSYDNKDKTIRNIKNGNLKLIKFLHKIGSKFDNCEVENAYNYGNVEVVKYLHSCIDKEDWGCIGFGICGRKFRTH